MKGWGFGVATISISAALLGAMAGSAVADTLNLETAIKESRAGSPQLQKAQAAADESRWRQTEMLSGFLPKITASAQHWLALKYQTLNLNFNGTPTTFPFIFPKSLLSVDLTLPLFDGLQNVRRYGAASSSREAAESELSWAEFQLEENTRLRFYQALAAMRLQDVARQNVKTLEDHLNQMKILRRGGVATNYDILRIEVQYHEAQSEELRAIDEVVVARQRLAEAMGLDDDARELDGELPTPDADRVKGVALGSNATARSDLRALELRQEAAERNESAEAAFWIPRVNLAGSYSLYNNQTNNLFSDYRSAYQLGVVLTWNLFDGMQSIARSRQAVYQKVQTEKSLRLAKLRIPRDFDLWKRKYLYSTALYAARITDVAKAQESVRLGHEGFRAGVRTSTDLLDAELDLFRARAGVVNAQMSTAEALVNLELALGKRI